MRYRISDYHFGQIKEIAECIEINAKVLSKKCPQDGCVEIEAIKFDVGLLKEIIKDSEGK